METFVGQWTAFYENKSSAIPWSMGSICIWVRKGTDDRIFGMKNLVGICIWSEQSADVVSVSWGLSLECLEPLNLIRHTLWYVPSLWSNWITVEKTNSIENQHRALEVHGGVFLLPDKWSRPEKALAGNVSFHKKAQGGWRWIFLQLCAFPQFSCLNFNHHYPLLMLRKKK